MKDIIHRTDLAPCPACGGLSRMAKHGGLCFSCTIDPKRARAAILKKALQLAEKTIHDLKRGSCWCEAGIGRPGHSCGCKPVLEALEQIKKIREDNA